MALKRRFRTKSVRKEGSCTSGGKSDSSEIYYYHYCTQVNLNLCFEISSYLHLHDILKATANTIDNLSLQ